MVIDITSQINNSVQKEDPFGRLLGDFGRWQFFVFGTISLVKVSFGWIQMAILFLTPNLIFRCVDLPNATEEFVNNTCYEGCLKYEYDTSPFDNTIVSEWDLVCERRWLASFTQTMMQFGVLVGSTVFGFLSDRYGRKITFLVSIAMVIIIGLVIPFSPSYTIFTILRTLHGVAGAGSIVVSFVIIMECVGSRYREAIGCLYQIPFMVGQMTVSPFAYYFRSWDKYMLAMGIPPLIYLGYFFTVTESPRWLVSQGRVKDATKIVKKAAAINNLPTTKIEETLTQLSQEITKSSDGPRLNYLALFQKSLLVKTVCCCLMWLIIGAIFYGLSQYISQTSPNPFISVALAGAFQIPSNIACIWLIKTLGRRLTTSLFFILSGVFVVILYLVPGIFIVELILGTLGISSAAIVACAIYIYTSEMYPTVVRNMAIGVCSTFMRIGSMIAPFISNAVVDMPWLPTTVFGVTALFAGLMCLILPETKGTNLPDSFDDIKTEK